MLNTSFVQSMVQSYVNNNKELSEAEFCDLFGGLDESELDEVLKLLDTMGVSIVEEKKEDLDMAKALRYLNNGMDATKLTALTNEQLYAISCEKQNSLSAPCVGQSVLLYRYPPTVRDTHTCGSGWVDLQR